MDALYYPNVEPPIRRLRSAALFFETVRSFVPEDSEKSLSAELREFAQVTKAWVPYRPTESTARLLDVSERTLDQAFAAIATARKSRAKLEITISPGGQFRVRDHVFMHGSKLSDRVRARLEAHGLMLPHGFVDGDWRIVNEQASDLILSYISDRLAANERWTSITDNEGCYIFNVLDSSAKGTGPAEAEYELARMIITDLVPDVIEKISIEKYCELRARYEAIRDRLNVFINEMTVENRLSHIRDRKTLHQAVRDCVKDLKKEVLSFRQTQFGRMFRKWGAFSLGSLINLATAAAHLDPVVKVSVAGAHVLLQAVDRTKKQKVTKRDEMVRLLAAARGNIISSLDIKRFLVA